MEGDLLVALIGHPVSVAGFIVLFICLLFRQKSSSQEEQSSPPSPPRKLPIFGHLLKLGSHPHITLQSYARRHGPLFLLHLGSKPTIVVSSSEIARDVMKTHDLVFANRPKSSMADKLLYNANDISAAPYGEYWRQMRSVGVLHLLSNKRVQSFRSVREEEVKLMIEKIQQNPISVNLTETFSGVTNNVVCRVALGAKYGVGEDWIKLRSLILEFLELLGSFGVRDFIPWLGWIDGISGLDARAKRVAKELDVFLGRVIQDHVDSENRDENSGKHKDLVDVLLWIQRNNTIGFPLEMDSIKALILDMFSAGTDTISTVLEWAMSELLKHPEVMKKLKSEIREISGDQYVNEDDLDKMHYLKAVIKETLRLHPPIPLLVPRESTQYVKLRGYDIKPKTRVMINAWAIGRDPEVWEEAEEFRPERFMNSSIDFKGQDFELIPFGAGRRGCPGVEFSTVINEIGLANLVHKFEWMLPNVSVAGFIILFIWLFFRQESSSQEEESSPPSPPRKLPIFGHLLKLGSHPHITLQSYARRHGPLFLLHLGSRPTIVVSSSELARDVMKTHDLVFANRPKSTKHDKLLYNSKVVAAAPYGEYWRQMKSIDVLHLLSNRRVQSFRSVREEEVKLMIEKIQQNPISVNLTETFSGLTNDVVCSVALGRKFDAGEDGMKLRSLLLELLELLGSFGIRDFIPWLGWIDGISGLDAKGKRVAKELDVFLDRVIQDHVHSENRDENSGKHKDLVDVLLWVQRNNSIGFPLEMDSIKALILDMFAAGTETTSTVLEWTMSELLKHPEVMKKLKSEIREISGDHKAYYVNEDDLDKMHYLKAVLKETLRLHPPIPLLVPRESTQCIKLRGYDIKPKTRVMINAWAIGRDPEVWDEAEEFRPERFMNNSIDFKGQDFELIPFGAGRRGCPGIAFATVINEVALANLVHKFEWMLPNGEDLDMTGAFGLTIHRKHPLVATATPC